MAKPTILVFRATGSQGAGVTKYLLSSSYAVRAFVTDASDPRAKALESLGAELFQGTIQNSTDIEHAVTGIHGVFLIQLANKEPGVEEQQARQVLELAKRAGVRQIVHSTGLANEPSVFAKINPESSMAYPMLGKAAVEKLVQEANFETWTILRPGYFMTNFLSPPANFIFPELPRERKFISSFRPDTLLPLIDPSDIGMFTTAAFLDPAKFHGKMIEIAGEKKRIDDLISDLSQTAGKSIEAVYRSDEETADLLAKSTPFIEGQVFVRDIHTCVDLQEVNSWGIQLTSFGEFLKKEGERVKATFSQ